MYNEKGYTVSSKCMYVEGGGTEDSIKGADKIVYLVHKLED